MNKRTIIILINIVISLVLIFIFIDPLWASVKVLRTEIVNQNEEVKKIEDLLVKVQEAEQDYHDVVESANQISLGLPQEKDLPYLLAKFETLASANGLLLESIGFSEEIERHIKEDSSSKKDEEISPFPYLVLEAKLSGSYEGLKGYLKSLENSIRLMEVREINFKSQQGDSNIDLSGLSIFEFNLKILVFYQ